VKLTVNDAGREIDGLHLKPPMPPGRRDVLGPPGRDRRLALDRPPVAELVAGVAAAVTSRAAAVSEDVYHVILRDIPQLRDDKPVLALLASSVGSNVDTCLQIMQHQIDLADVQAPTAAVEYARRLAQRGTPLTALLRAYRVGHACFSGLHARKGELAA
jgi:hypothetical protein